MRIVFVCYANMCRSPMAEGLARKELHGLAEVESVGTHAWGGSAAPEAITVMRSEFGIDISSHRSRNVRDLKLDDFDRIIADVNLWFNARPVYHYPILNGERA